MRLHAEFTGSTHAIDLQRTGSRAIAQIDNRRYELDVRETRSGIYVLMVDDQIFECRVEGLPESGQPVDVAVGTTHYSITLTDPKRLRGAQSAGAQTDGSARIVAPMPGRVVRVLVEVGSHVAAGAGVVVVEAMKMQNELKSPKAGVVASLNTETGAAVNAGDVLVVIE